MVEKTKDYFIVALDNFIKEKYGDSQTSFIQDAKTKGIKIANSTLSSILREKRGARSDMQEKIASACGYTLEDFIAYGKAIVEGPRRETDNAADLEALRCAVKSLSGVVDYLREENANLKREIAKLKMKTKEYEPTF